MKIAVLDTCFASCQVCFLAIAGTNNMIHEAKIAKEFPMSGPLVVQALKITFGHASCTFKSFMLMK